MQRAHALPQADLQKGSRAEGARMQSPSNPWHMLPSSHQSERTAPCYQHHQLHQGHPHRRNRHPRTPAQKASPKCTSQRKTASSVSGPGKSVGQQARRDHASEASKTHRRVHRRYHRKRSLEWMHEHSVSSSLTCPLCWWQHYLPHRCCRPPPPSSTSCCQCCTVVPCLLALTPAPGLRRLCPKRASEHPRLRPHVSKTERRHTS
mmetsp:Transcript_44615/g.127990  ORF Transcript_44615/g.127990 Transcript_44615/m.127990 type:complete len:205 (-) Transcript_44615:978-1592(-)